MGDVTNAQKIEFVSNLKGTHVANIYLLYIPWAALCMLRGFVHLLIDNSSFRVSGFASFNLDFILTVLPLIFTITSLFESLLTVCILSSILFLGISVSLWKRKKDQFPRSAPSLADLTTLGSDFCATTRATLNILTAIAILAVDFHVFPRELAKAEWYGTGLMDVGTGCFIFCNAMVSRIARGKESDLPAYGRVMNAAKSSFYLIIIGFARFFALFTTGYHTHVGEYGVHWNFFLTLSVVNILSAVLFSLFSLRGCGVIALVLCVVHQGLLSMGLSNFMQFANNRSNIVLANLEGIVSSVGYLILSVFGAAFGRLVFQRFMHASSLTRDVLITAFLSTSAFTICFLLQQVTEPICRATANVPYVFWLTSYCIFFVLLPQIVHLPVINFCPELSPVFNCKCQLCAKGHLSQCWCIFPNVNKNQLLFFLLANILTGATNLSIDTFVTDNMTALLVLSAYMYILCLIFVLYPKIKPRSLFQSNKNKHANAD